MSSRRTLSGLAIFCAAAALLTSAGCYRKETVRTGAMGHSSRANIDRKFDETLRDRGERYEPTHNSRVW